MINPFNVQAIFEKSCANSFMKIGKIEIHNRNTGQKGTQAYLSENYYISTCTQITRKHDRKLQSPILDEKDVNAVADNMRYLTRSSVMVAWAFIPIPLSGLFIPFAAGYEIPFSYFIALSAFIAVALLTVSQFYFWRFFFLQKELGDQLWKRGGTVHIPKGLWKWQLKQDARLWAGPASAILLDQAVELVSHDGIKFAYEAINLSSDVIKLKRTGA